MLRGEAHVAGRQQHHAIGKFESFQHGLGASCHALVLVGRLLRRGDRHQLDFGELVLADHAARVLAGRARFGAEARRAGGDAHRQLRFVDDLLAHEIGQRHFGGGDEPEIAHFMASSHSGSSERSPTSVGFSAQIRIVHPHWLANVRSTSLSIRRRASMRRRTDRPRTSAIARCRTWRRRAPAAAG